MNHTINISIKEIIEFNSSYEDRKSLIEFITYDCMSESDRKSYIKKLLEDLLETENEFDNRTEVKNAINLISKTFGEL